MPIVTIQVTREATKPGAHSVTAAEKAALIKSASELLLKVLNRRTNRQAFKDGAFESACSHESRAQH